MFPILRPEAVVLQFGDEFGIIECRFDPDRTDTASVNFIVASPPFLRCFPDGILIFVKLYLNVYH
jgi:hypothetical protein